MMPYDTDPANTRTDPPEPGPLRDAIEALPVRPFDQEAFRAASVAHQKASPPTGCQWCHCIHPAPDVKIKLVEEGEVVEYGFCSLQCCARWFWAVAVMGCDATGCRRCFTWWEG